MAIADNHKSPQQILTMDNQNCSSLEAEIISQTPGRLRLRVIPADRQPEKIVPLANALKARLEIYRVKTNISTGSITVLYGSELLNSQDMCIIVQDLGINLLEINQEPQILSVSSSSSAATEIIKTTTDLNRTVQTATNNTVDLRFLIPLSLGILAMRQLLIKGWQLELIPWYVLAWYAFDSFLKLHSTNNVLNPEA